MIYLMSFMLSTKKVKDPYIYPYNVFKDKDLEPFVFSPVTVLYGNNGSGKSTILNIIASKLRLKGKEYTDPFLDSEIVIEDTSSIKDYYVRYAYECTFSLADDERTGRPFKKIPDTSRYIKSEDILYEVKKVEQKHVLADGMVYDYVKKGMTKAQAEKYLKSSEGSKQLEYIIFGQEKYSNGETAIQYFDDNLIPDSLYLLDEPEVSLSPANQVKLAEEINKMTYLLGCQFIIATHSPFMLGTLSGAKIYNIDTVDYRTCKWSELENVRYFYDFFMSKRDEFD